MAAARSGKGTYRYEAERLRDIDDQTSQHLKSNGRWAFISLALIVVGALLVAASGLAMTHDVEIGRFHLYWGMAAGGVLAVIGGLVIRYFRRRLFESLVRDRAKNLS